MLLTFRFLNETDPRSPLVRKALRQSGDGARICALKTMLLSIGCCELTSEDVQNLGASVRKHRFSFMSVPLSFVPLKERDFERFPKILAPTDLEVAHIRHGIIGLRNDASPVMEKKYDDIENPFKTPRRSKMMEMPIDHEVLEAIERLNEDIDRCILIGRNALNLRLYPGLFATGDCDIMCPDLDSAVECARILDSLGFRRDGATFVSKNGAELDLIIGSSKDPPGPLSSFYNAPELSPLWQKRERVRQINVPPIFDLILNRLLTARDNEGRDVEVVNIYLKLNPEAFPDLLNAVMEQPDERRDKMLFSLYQATADMPKQKRIVEETFMKNLNTIEPTLEENEPDEPEYDIER